ncbi:hypothetical protein ES703_57496 [subsurface metagenome]
MGFPFEKRGCGFGVVCRDIFSVVNIKMEKKSEILLDFQCQGVDKGSGGPDPT